MAKEKGRNVILGDALKTGLGDNSYEVCAMVEVLEHIDDFEAALSEARRVAASRLVMTVPNIGVIPAMSEFLFVPWHLLEATHVNFFTPGSLEHVLLRVFPRVTVWKINQWFQPNLHMNIAAVAWKH
jgi:ubiquinone/menaquinone biosynthesis C-methylase UbiE